MRVVIQRVKYARVFIDSKISAEIKYGLLLLAGIHKDDSIDDVRFIAEKIPVLRIFPDDNHKMNLAIRDVNGSLLVVSQFTLFAATDKGNRPDFNQAAPPDKARTLYLEFLELLKKSGIPVSSGVFGANMQIELLNDGPVTIIMNSKQTADT